MPTQPARLPSVVGTDHIAQVRATVEEFTGWDARYGGGLMREAVTAQLRYCAELLGARCPEPIRGDLLTAVGSFAETAGYMAYDNLAYDDAQRAYRFALVCAEEAGDWHLHAQVLCSMAEQVSWCGDPDTGLAYTESALVRAIRLTPTERAMLHHSRARDLARLGKVHDAMRAVGAAPTSAPPSPPPDTICYQLGTGDTAKHAGSN